MRFLGGVPLLGSDFSYSLEPVGSSIPAAAIDTPESTAVSFYQFLVKGEYGKAWEISVEPMWTESSKVPFERTIAPTEQPLGWTSESDFVRRCTDELGAGGSGLKLNAVRATPGEGARGGGKDAVLKRLAASRVSPVHVTGHMLGACLIYRWDKDLLVANISGKNKVILPGTKAANTSYHQSWFAGVELIGSLRKGAP
jgi:hypothetical protein